MKRFENLCQLMDGHSKDLISRTFCLHRRPLKTNALYSFYESYHAQLAHAPRQRLKQPVPVYILYVLSLI